MQIFAVIKTICRNLFAEMMSERLLGKYRAKVIDNEDPEKLGRIRAHIPELMGRPFREGENVHSGNVSNWALPCFPYAGSGVGLICIPEVGDTVWVEFEGGDIRRPIWVGGWLNKVDGSTEAPTETSSAKYQSDAKVLITRGGNKVILQDEFSTSEDPYIQVVTKEGDSLKLDANSTLGVVLEDKNGNTVTLKSTGVKIEDEDGNYIEFTLTAGKVVMKDSSTVFELGNGATKQLVNNFPYCLFTGAAHSTCPNVKA